MKKAIYISIFTIINISSIYVFYIYDKSLILKTYESPDGKYELIIKNDRGIFASTMPGDGGLGNCLVKVILKNAKNKLIGTSDSS